MQVEVCRVKIESLVFNFSKIQKVIDQIEKHGWAEEWVLQQRLALLLIFLGNDEAFQLVERVIVI